MFLIRLLGDMGTSSLICIIHNGQLRVAHFSCFDGYPDSHGHGMTILRFLHRSGNIERLTQGLKHLYATGILDAEDVNIAVDETAASMAKMTITTPADVPLLHRELGARILKMITRASPETPLSLPLDIDQATDSQWVYLLDLDRGTFEVFTGASMTRFDRASYGNADRGLFFPPQVAVFRFEALPSSEAQFVRSIKKSLSV